MNIADERDTADVLAMRVIWDRNPFIVGEIRCVICPLATLDCTRDLRNDVHRTFVGAHHVRETAIAIATIALSV